MILIHPEHVEKILKLHKLIIMTYHVSKINFKVLMDL